MGIPMCEKGKTVWPCDDLDIEKAKARMEAGSADRDARRKKAEEVSTDEPITLVSGSLDEIFKRERAKYLASRSPEQAAEEQKEIDAFQGLTVMCGDPEQIRREMRMTPKELEEFEEAADRAQRPELFDD